ncbi:hypothetical protein OG394_39440 [Kribbella sp. NBC_01245]|uniref:hypothetical protein n=1 Tax=Kribbella sp. NBC_01245 TaxID=2903578 RepID=UPI002E2DB9CA|nr:hypothetical protein [Kribbella sp. NBC_01245]
MLVKERVRAAGGVGVEAAQAELSQLLPSIADDHDRRIAQTLIDGFPSRTAPPAPPTELYSKAVRILESADRPGHPLEQRVVAIEGAHRAIWALADGAPDRVRRMGEQISVAEFNVAFSDARARVRKNAGATLAEEQRALTDLAGRLAEQKDRDWAHRLVAKLARSATPPPAPGPFLAEAIAVEKTAHVSGSREERIAAIADARRKILEIAGRAPTEEAAHIVGLTRTLDHLEEALDDPFWELGDPPAVSS